MTTSNLSVAVSAATAFFKAHGALAKAAVKYGDTFTANGGDIEWLKAPRGDAATEEIVFGGETMTRRFFYDSHVAAFNATLPASEKKLLDADVKTLSEAQKKDRARIQAKSGTAMRDLRRSVEAAQRREEEGEEKGGTPSRTRPMASRIRQECEKLCEAIRKDDAPTGYKPAEVIKALEAAIAACPVR